MKESPHTKEMMEDDEITLKELILKLQEYFREVWNHKKLLFLIPIPVVLFMLYQAFTTPKVYPATLTFMVNEDEGGGIGGMGALLGQVLGGGAAGGKYNLDKILELSRTRKIMEEVLLDKATVDGQTDLLANHIIRINELHKDWNKSDNEKMHNFLFSQQDKQKFGDLENAVLLNLYGEMIGSGGQEGVLSTGYGKETGIMKIKTQSRSEDLSIALANKVYEKLSNYYIKKTIEKQQKTYEVILQKVDSIKHLLDSKQYALANFKDSNRGLFTATAKVSETKLTQEVTALGMIYAKSLENLEMADFSLKIKTPFVQLIDAPVGPIEPVGKSKVMAIIMGGFLGAFLAITFILARKIYLDAMKE
jgi:G-rich domain on putative tyrosine kinase